MKHHPGVLAVSALVALTSTACNANNNDDSPSSSPTGFHRGGTLTIYTPATAQTLDPATDQSLATTSLGLVHRRLTTWDVRPGRPPKVVPDLATNTGVPSDGGRTWTYTLKKGLKLSNGDAVTSQDIKYGLERSFAPELSGGLGYHKTLLVGGDTYTGPYHGKQLSSIQTPNDQTIVFHLKTPYGDWPWIASMPAFAPVPQSADKNPSTYGQDPVASGPYEVASAKPGHDLVLKRNTDWDKSTDPVRLAGPDTIDVKLGVDDTTAAQQLISDKGEARDAFGASFVPPAQLKQITSDPDAKKRLALSNTGALEYLAINTQRPRLDNVKVRQAIEYAVDKRAFQLAVGGTQGGDLATTVLMPGIPGRQQYDLYPAPASGDVDKAKQLLAAAGSTNLQLTMVSSSDSTSLAQAQAVQQGLQRAGIKVTIEPVDPNVYISTVTGDKGDYDLTVSAWQPDYPSANAAVSPLFDSSQIGRGGFNMSRYSNPAVDRLIAQAIGEVNPQKAEQDWATVDEQIMKDAPVVPLLYARNAFLRGGNVKNFDVSGFPPYPNFLRIWLAAG